MKDINFNFFFKIFGYFLIIFFTIITAIWLYFKSTIWNNWIYIWKSIKITEINYNYAKNIFSKFWSDFEKLWFIDNYLSFWWLIDSRYIMENSEWSIEKYFWFKTINKFDLTKKNIENFIKNKYILWINKNFSKEKPIKKNSNIIQKLTYLINNYWENELNLFFLKKTNFNFNELNKSYWTLLFNNLNKKEKYNLLWTYKVNGEKFFYTDYKFNNKVAYIKINCIKKDNWKITMKNESVCNHYKEFNYINWLLTKTDLDYLNISNDDIQSYKDYINNIWVDDSINTNLYFKLFNEIFNKSGFVINWVKIINYKNWNYYLNTRKDFINWLNINNILFNFFLEKKINNYKDFLLLNINNLLQWNILPLTLLNDNYNLWENKNYFYKLIWKYYFWDKLTNYLLWNNDLLSHDDLKKIILIEKLLLYKYSKESFEIKKEILNWKINKNENQVTNWCFNKLKDNWLFYKIGNNNNYCILFNWILKKLNFKNKNFNITNSYENFNVPFWVVINKNYIFVLWFWKKNWSYYNVLNYYKFNWNEWNKELFNKLWWWKLVNYFIWWSIIISYILIYLLFLMMILVIYFIWLKFITSKIKKRTFNEFKK